MTPPNSADEPKPVDPTAQTAPAFPALEPMFARHHPARVLVVDDNAVNQKVLARTLQKLGYDPEVVGDGRAAVNAVRDRSFDLVLMDVEMPELDGPAATREIRAGLPPDKQPVIVAVTANALPQNRAEYLAAGMDDYVSKPIHLDQLKATLARLDSLRHH